MNREERQNIIMIDETQKHKVLPKIKVIGIGTSGIKIVNHMIACGMQGVEFIAIDADKQALLLSKAKNRILIGETLLNGLDAGQYPEFGKDAAELARDRLIEQLQGADMVFITTGMGSNTGSSAVSIIAEYARENGVLTVGVVTKPFSFEGKRRMNQAEAGIVDLQDRADAVIVIPDDSLLQLIDRRTSIQEAFKFADDVIYSEIQGILGILTANQIHADFEDVKAILENAGTVRIGIGTGKGRNGAKEAAKVALKNPMLRHVSIKDALGVLLNITGGESMTLDDVREAIVVITEAVDPDAHIIFGANVDDKLAKDEFHVTVVLVRCINTFEREVCGNCKGIYFKGDKYCRFCGAPMGKPEYIEEVLPALYGPPPVKRVYTCAKCGYSWESYSMIDNVHYCPKCGGDTAKLISKEDWRS